MLPVRPRDSRTANREKEVIIRLGGGGGMKSFGRLDSRSGMLARRGFVVLWFSHNVKCMASNWFYVRSKYWCVYMYV